MEAPTTVYAWREAGLWLDQVTGNAPVQDVETVARVLAHHADTNGITAPGIGGMPTYGITGRRANFALLQLRRHRLIKLHATGCSKDDVPNQWRLRLN